MRPRTPRTRHSPRRSRCGTCPGSTASAPWPCSAIITTHTVGALPGGFLSVDVFFALSGYLITSLLVSEWRHDGTISLHGSGRAGPGGFFRRSS